MKHLAAAIKDGGGTIYGKKQNQIRKHNERYSTYQFYARLSAIVWNFRALRSEPGIIDLKYRTAGEIMRIIQSLLGPGDTVSGKKNIIFLTTTPVKLVRIHAIIRNLDQKIRQVKKTVIQGRKARKALASVNVSGNIF